MTLNDTMQHYTTVYKTIQHYNYKAIRHHTTLYKTIQQYIRLYDTVRHYVRVNYREGGLYVIYSPEDAQRPRAVYHIQPNFEVIN